MYSVHSGWQWALFEINRKFNKSVFHERGKPKYLEKNLSEQGGQLKTKLSQYNGITSRIQTLVT